MNHPSLQPVELLDAGKHRFDSFSSGVEDLDRWLVNTAVIAALAHTAATWVLCRGGRVVGYYALAMGSVVRADAPQRLSQGQPDPVPILLLARLAIDISEQGHGLGGDLLRDALIRGLTGAKQFGARAIIVDAIDEAAAHFYEHYGFIRLSHKRLYRRVSDIEKAGGGLP